MNFKLLTPLLMFSLVFPSICFGKGSRGSGSGGDVYVHGYTRKDGTEVSSYTRRSPGTAGDSTADSSTPSSSSDRHTPALMTDEFVAHSVMSLDDTVPTSVMWRRLLDDGEGKRYETLLFLDNRSPQQEAELMRLIAQAAARRTELIILFTSNTLSDTQNLRLKELLQYVRRGRAASDRLLIGNKIPPIMPEGTTKEDDAAGTTPQAQVTAPPPQAVLEPETQDSVESEHKLLALIVEQNNQILVLLKQLVNKK